MSKWSKEAWTAAASIYAQIIDLPFVRGLADGSLSHERFMHYITQDSLYIGEYFRVLSHIASGLGTSSHAADFVAFAADGVAVEKALHESYISLSDRKETAMHSQGTVVRPGRSRGRGCSALLLGLPESRRNNIQRLYRPDKPIQGLD